MDGFDVIKLKAEARLTEEQQDVIRELIDHLFGLEMTEVTGKMVTIQCLFFPRPVEQRDVSLIDCVDYLRILPT